MGLTGWLLRRTPARPLLAVAVGGDPIRAAVERECERRGWRPARSPAEANLLVVCGTPDSATAQAIQAVWQQIPLPRARLAITVSGDAPTMLDEALVRLRDADSQRQPAGQGAEMVTDQGHATAEHRDRPRDGEASAHHAPHDRPGNHDHHADEADGHNAPEHHHGADHTGHRASDQHGAGHHHEHDAMAMPGGIGMADRADDRDGLKLDRITVVLGPVLHHWPPGLRIRLAVQGDVVQAAEVEVLARRGAVIEPPMAALLDRVHRLLVLAGWDAAAREGRLLRDALIGGTEPSRIAVRYRRWSRRVRRSRVLRWSLSGLGVVQAPESTMDGDVLDRLVRWLDSLDAGMSGGRPGPGDAAEHTEHALRLLPATLVGADLAAVRLIVASVAPDPAALSTMEVVR